MLKAFHSANGFLREQELDEAGSESTLLGAAWIDINDPTDAERALVERHFQAGLPDVDDVEEIEATSRYFTVGRDLHIHSLFLYPSEGRYKTASVAFVLRPDRLLTLRDTELPDFRLLRMRARRGWAEADGPLSVAILLFELKVENLADILEDIHRRLEDVTHMVLEDDNAELEDAIDRLAKLEDSNGKIRLCLMDTQRSVSFLQRHIRQHPESQQACREIMRDVDTLMSHTAFLFEKINFLMDAAQGFVNIKQNQIIKIFSIAAVVFLPPTLVASIYGMNFRFMPELQWTFGYPFALSLMVAAGIAPYWYFKRKGWL